VASGCLLCAAASHGAPEPLRVAEELPFELATRHPYAGQPSAEPALVWSEALHVPGATYLAPHFARFELAPQDFVLVRSPDRKQVWRYERLGRANLGREGFWSSHVKGDRVVVELYSRWAEGAFGFVIDRVARGYTEREVLEVNGLDGIDRAICGADDSDWAPCFEQSDPQIYDAARTTARLLINGSAGCTGWLVGCEGHLLTNNHCIDSASDALNTDYEFLAEGATCSTNCTGFGACPGIVEATSGTLIRTSAALDYALIKLPDSLAEDYGFLRLRDSGPVVGERIFIPQHAAAWGKRIAVESSDPDDASGFCEVSSLNRPPCTGGPGDVGYQCDTRDGSSGSAVVAYDDLRVVALHHCANCPNRGLNIVDVIASLGADLPACATAQLAGTIELDHTLYRCDLAPTITVRDDSILGAGSVAVSAWSDSESVPETVELAEFPPGRFSGVLALGGEAAQAGDGVLSVGDGDTLHVEYVDADDGAGGANVVQRVSAALDCAAPALAGTRADLVTGTSATVEWTTNEPADGRVEHGESQSLGQLSGVGPLGTEHRIRVGGLAECATHWFSVSSADVAGNTGADDNGGLLFQFDTGRDVRTLHASADTPLGIPDAEPAGAVSTIGVADPRPVTDVEVRVDIDHLSTADLTLALLPPVGPPIQLALAAGGTGDDFTHTLFDDDAPLPIAAGSAPFTGVFRPQQPLGAAIGIAAAGDWRLRVIDRAQTGIGQLLSWELFLSFAPRACGPLADYASHAVEADWCSGGGSGAANLLWDAGERVDFRIELHNGGDETLSGVHAEVVPLDARAQMLDSVAEFADLEPGETRASLAPHLVVQLAPDLACGEHLPFLVQVTSDQGAWTRGFTQVVGDAAPQGGVALVEGFAAGIPAGWSVQDGAADGRSWFADNLNDPASCASVDPFPPLAGGWVAVDSDCAGLLPAPMDEALVSPLVDLGAALGASLEFDHYFQRHAGESAEVDVRSSLTGGAWIHAASWSGTSTGNPEHAVVDLTPLAAGAADVQIRWRYRDASFAWFWYLDNVRVSYASAGPCTMAACAVDTSGPPPVSDLAVQRLALDGTSLGLAWSAACPAPGARVLYGPLDQVAQPALGGAVCGVSAPATWNGVPAGDLWFVVVHDDGQATEGSWGRSSFGERNGLEASGLCGSTLKDLDGTCP
jgi:subtilisin-like proprotein convertase family protein